MRAALFALLLAGCAAAQGQPSAAAPQAAQLAEGQRLVQENCAPCHAIGREGESPHPEAPPFRTLSHNYPLTDLEEALAEGIVSGHRDMPQFAFEPAQIDAIVAYLNSIQEPRPE